MAPGLKTYGNKNASINRSIDVFNALFAENLAKRKQNKQSKKKKPVKIKPLPARTQNTALLSDDSIPLIVNTNTTFDKLLRGEEEKVNNNDISDKSYGVRNRSKSVSNHTDISTNIASSSKCDDTRSHSSRRVLFRTNSEGGNLNETDITSKTAQSNNDKTDDFPFAGLDQSFKLNRQGVITSTPFTKRIRIIDDTTFLEESMKQIEEWSFKPPNFESTRQMDNDWKLAATPRVLLKRFDEGKRKQKELIVNVTRIPENVMKFLLTPKKELTVNLERLSKSVMQQKTKVASKNWSKALLIENLKNVSGELSSLNFPDRSSYSEELSNNFIESPKGISRYKCVTRRRRNFRTKSMPDFSYESTNENCSSIDNSNDSSNKISKINSCNNSSLNKSINKSTSINASSTSQNKSALIKSFNKSALNINNPRESVHKTLKMYASASSQNNTIKDFFLNVTTENLNRKKSNQNHIKSSINRNCEEQERTSNINKRSKSINDRNIQSPDLFSDESSLKICSASVEDFETFAQSIYKTIEDDNPSDINQQVGFVNTRRRNLKRRNTDSCIMIDVSKELSPKRLKTVNMKRGSGKSTEEKRHTTHSIRIRNVAEVSDIIDSENAKYTENSQIFMSGNIQSHEVSNVIVSEDSFLIPLVKKRYTLKPGKLWKRSLMMLKITSFKEQSQESLNILENNGHSYSNWNPSEYSRVSVCRKSSIKILPIDTSDGSPKQISTKKSTSYAPPYEPSEILQGSLAQYFEGLSVNSTTAEEDLTKKKSLLSIGDSINETSLGIFVETAKDIVLRKCGQTEPLPFSKCYSDDLLKNCHKIGEGVFGEVYLFRNRKGTTSVMKVIPIEGDLIVNGERQKKFEEILTEITIAMELSNLRQNKKNSTGSFNQVEAVHCVQGKYPARLLDLWDLYDEARCSENDCPSVFGPEQLYIVLELANGGKDLESFVFNNSKQAYTLFQQAACALAVAESALQFEHRDLHWGNVLISPTDKDDHLTYNLHGRQIDIATNGVQISIIDFTLSRITADTICIYNDLSQDPDLFDAEGDYQFEIYRLMQKYNHNDWEHFEPYTNILWLHYMLDKMITAVRYKYAQSKCHSNYMFKLKQLKEAILEFKSAEEFVSHTFV